MKSKTFLVIRLCMCVAAALLLAHIAVAQSYVPGKADKRMPVQPVVAMKAFNFPLSAVRLLESPFKTAMDADGKYLLMIEPDRLLAGFREHAALVAKGKVYGGWESSGLAGHTLGHYLSACSMQYAATADTAFLHRVQYIITELAACQQNRKTGYIGTIPKEDSIWAEVAAGRIHSRGFDLNGAWSPWYTVHKIMAGLLDAYLYCGNQEALDINKKLADWTGNTIKNLSDSLMQQMLACEYGGMTETLANTYALSGDKKYLSLSYRFYDTRILDSLAAREDVLPGKHSNTQIPKVIGSARRYELTGDPRDAVIANYFWKVVTTDHSYATGGNSNYEYLGPARKLNDQLTDNTTETCNTYNMLKLTRHLFAVQPAAGLMDYYERALYNHILASQNHSDGMMCYFVPLRMGGQKKYSSPFNTFTCCVGSGMENHVKYGESIYFEGSDGSLYINLFIPSVLSWKNKNITLKQETTLPAGNTTTFTITTPAPITATLRIRKPAWSDNASVLVNGKPAHANIAADGYMLVTRKWNNNDKIVYRLNPILHTETMPDNQDRRAVFYGPLLLAGRLGKTEPDPAHGIPVFVNDSKEPAQWIKRQGSAELIFETVNTAVPSEVQLVPFNQVQDDYYAVYWDVFTRDKWAQQQKIYEEEKIKQQALDAKTTDVLRMGEMQPERDHALDAAHATSGDAHGKKWRAAKGGNLSFTMKVKPGTDNMLICTYWGMDNRSRKFDILADGEKIASEDLNLYKESRFYEVSYKLGASLIKDKNSVTITLQPAADNTAGPVYGCRMTAD